MTKESLECLTLQNDSLKSSYKNLQDELLVIKNIYSPFSMHFNNEFRSKSRILN